ncbi:hypothetical protein GE061_017181 [Apolygus lucorum]|uniref:Chitin-binding type-2 domain-containing protein n=1 Tax=Apolygus lucorum TaxID=248454 RepID=A0A8S9XAD9_APOLU|nr:hypothetical protein GE061_017181 [Apolygus lucorum]
MFVRRLQLVICCMSYVLCCISEIQVSTGECKSEYACKDCYTARLCRPSANGTYEEVDTRRCPPDAPYCHDDTGMCNYQASEKCLNPTNFICMSDGHFPDPNCNFYYVCKGLKATKIQCENPNMVFNPYKGVCDYGPENCGWFDCYRRPPGVKTPYSTSSSYFAYCGGDNEPTAIDKCLEATFFNQTSQACEPMCFDKEGTIPDPFDCTKYYKCSKTWVSMYNWEMIKEHDECPPDTGYDHKHSICVSLKNLPSCQPSKNKS